MITDVEPRANAAGMRAGSHTSRGVTTSAQSVAIFDDFTNPLSYHPRMRKRDGAADALQFMSVRYLASDLITIPPLIVFQFFNPQLVAVLTAGAVKGQVATGGEDLNRVRLLGQISSQEPTLWLSVSSPSPVTIDQKSPATNGQRLKVRTRAAPP